jgi:tetratricopeptide (TPR) repeat protein
MRRFSISAKEIAHGVRNSNAAALAVDNAPLNSFLGEYFFGEGKHKLAHDYLQRAFRAGTQVDSPVPLLLGITCGDLGDVKQSVELIEAWIKIIMQVPSARIMRLASCLRLWIAGARRWRSSKALAARPCAEMNYVMGCVYYKLEKDSTAERYLRKAIALDQNYAAAHFALGVVLLRTSGLAVARKAFNVACAAEDRTHPLSERNRRPVQNKEAGILADDNAAIFAAPGSNSAAEGIITGGSTHCRTRPRGCVKAPSDSTNKTSEVKSLWLSR